MRFIHLMSVAIIWGLLIANQSSNFNGDSMPTVDAQATKQTKALYANLKKVAESKVMFGHQDAMAYGVEWKHWQRRRTDVKDVCGKHPAVFGWDVSKLGQTPYNIDDVDFEEMKDWIKRVYRLGGINTISWHMDNFYGGDSWTTDRKVVKEILPGGSKHQDFVDKLDLFAAFLQDLHVGFLSKKYIPIVFRPFHEHTGSWFWWGRDHCTPEQYIELWQFTADYLMNQKGIHHLLWAYSPDVFRDKEHYLECYPGDDYVDILGFDDYHDVGKDGHIDDLTRQLVQLVDMAEEKDKVAALTETGYETIPDQTWWTNKLLAALKADPRAKGIAWVHVWRNARTDHHYAPYPGHISADNFIEFSRDPLMLFEDGLVNMYRLNR